MTKHIKTALFATNTAACARPSSGASSEGSPTRLQPEPSKAAPAGDDQQGHQRNRRWRWRWLGVEWDHACCIRYLPSHRCGSLPSTRVTKFPRAAAKYSSSKNPGPVVLVLCFSLFCCAQEELESKGVKCGGTHYQRAARLFSLKRLAPEDYPKNLLAKKAKKAAT